MKCELYFQFFFFKTKAYYDFVFFYFFDIFCICFICSAVLVKNHSNDYNLWLFTTESKLYILSTLIYWIYLMHSYLYSLYPLYYVFFKIIIEYIYSSEKCPEYCIINLFSRKNMFRISYISKQIIFCFKHLIFICIKY